MKNAMLMVISLLLLVVSLVLFNRTALAQGTGTTITPLLTKEVVGMPAKELETMTVEYAPGAIDPVHAHHAPAMVYVLARNNGLANSTCWMRTGRFCNRP